MLKEKFNISFPDNHLTVSEQDEEYCFIENAESSHKSKIRLHDYNKIYQIEGLYEYIFLEKLKYISPEIVCRAFSKEIAKSTPHHICILDLGAGNGIAGEWLKKLGFNRCFAIDIEPEAKKSALRDRPGIYEEYFVVDLANLSISEQFEIEKIPFNCMVSVGSLGFSDIPPEVFAKGFNLLSNPGWVSFNIKEDFVFGKDCTGFSCLIQKMEKEGILNITQKHKYRHRLSIHGNCLYYYVFTGRKLGDIPLEWLG